MKNEADFDKKKKSRNDYGTFQHDHLLALGNWRKLHDKQKENAHTKSLTFVNEPSKRPGYLCSLEAVR